MSATAQDIVASFDSVRRIFGGRITGWYKLVRICAATEPVPITHLREGTFTRVNHQDSTNHALMARWEKAGLVRITNATGTRTRGRYSRKRVQATEKAYRLLRLTPPGAPICNRPQTPAQSATSQPSTPPTNP